MDIDKIVKERPKAWEECLLFLKLIEKNSNEIESVDFTPECGTIDISDNGFIWESFHFRKLYDYFDSVGIKVSVYFDADDDWCYEVLPLNPELIVRGRWYSYRQDVERIAIPKAFEIREQQLNKEV